MELPLSSLGIMAAFLEKPAFAAKVKEEGKDTEVDVLTFKLSQILMPIAIEYVLGNINEKEIEGWV